MEEREWKRENGKRKEKDKKGKGFQVYT